MQREFNVLLATGPTGSGTICWVEWENAALSTRLGPISSLPTPLLKIVNERY